MVLVVTAAVCGAIVSTLPTSAQAVPSAVKKVCPRQGSQSVSGNRIYTCILVKKILVWDSGRVFKYIPTSTSTPTPTPTPTHSDVAPSSPSMAFKPTADWPIPTPMLGKGPYTWEAIVDPSNTLKWPDQVLGIDQLHKQGLTGKNTAVAFIEGTNIDMSDPYFANTKVICIASVPLSKDFAEVSCPTTSDPQQSHAEGVAGTIAGVHGVAPDTTLISIAPTTSSVAEAVSWVVANADKYGIKVVSISMGTNPDNRLGILCGRVGIFIDQWRLALAALASKDIAVLLASGNDGLLDGVLPPGCMPGPIVVGATYARNGSIFDIASYSNVSSDLDLLAPSTLYSEGLNHKQQEFSGTSQATPFAAGVFALAKSARPDANMAQIFYFLKRYATPVDDILVKGIPMIQPFEAIEALMKATSLPPVSFVQEIQTKTSR